MTNKHYIASQRMRNVQTPIIPTVSKLIQKTPDTISFGQGVVYYPPPSTVIEHISKMDFSDDFHLYSTVEGLPELRGLIEKKLKTENSINLSNNQEVVVTAGANMAFLNALLAITDPGDEVILLRPYYFNHEMAITMLNCKAVVVDTDTDYQPCLDLIEKAISKRTRAIVTVSPNNPTGAVYPEITLKQINLLCLEYGIYHISDEAYEYFTYDDSKHYSVCSQTETESHTIALYSLSKAYGFASWRIGYMVIPEHLNLAISKAQDTNLICPTRIAQEAAIKALECGRSYAASKLEQIRIARQTLYTALQSIKNICTTPYTSGAFYFLIKLDTPLSGMEVVEQLIKIHQIAVIPGETFGMNNGCYLRIAYGALDTKTTESGINRLTHGLTNIIK